MTTTATRRGVYVCTSRSCKRKGEEFTAMLPAAARLARGTPVRCGECGAVVSMRRVEEIKVESMPTLAQAEAALGEPASKWVARCYEIACGIVDAKIVPAGSTAVYGHWIGPVAPGSHFDRGSPLPFVQHGWVLLPDGGVLDPTRWVFEGRKPYLYIGPADHYDEGGNAWREASAGPPPPWEPDEDQYEFTSRMLPSAAWTFVEKLLRLDRYYDRDSYKTGTISKRQLFWLANVSPQKLGPHALPIFKAICKLDQSALIPIDNLRRVERENRVELDR